MTERRAVNPRKTVGVLAVASALLVMLQVSQQRWTAALVVAAVVLLLGLSALSRPASDRIHRAWMRVGGVLGYVNSRILLCLSFFLVLVPTGLLMRLTGRDMLRLQRGPGSWWVQRRLRAQSRSGFERGF